MTAESALQLTSTHRTATTYSFHTPGPGFRSWALCTVNDQTGELLITSDWGDWSYRWNTGALGFPTLTAFLGTRGGVDYIARKLQGKNGGQQFSLEKTIAAVRRELCERRLQAGQTGHPKGLTRAVAREIWVAIGEAGEDCYGSDDIFVDRLNSIEGVMRYVSETPYDLIKQEPTPEDRALDRLLAAIAPTEDEIAADIEAMTDEEIETELRADGIDPKACADEMRAKMLAWARGRS